MGRKFIRTGQANCFSLAKHVTAKDCGKGLAYFPKNLSLITTM